MGTPFSRRFGLVLGGIVVVVAVACVWGGWTGAREIGLALILGGAVAITLGALLGPTPTRRTSRDPYMADLFQQAQVEDLERIAKRPADGLLGWLAAGTVAIVVGVLLRVL